MRFAVPIYWSQTPQQANHGRQVDVFPSPRRRGPIKTEHRGVSLHRRIKRQCGLKYGSLSSFLHHSRLLLPVGKAAKKNCREWQLLLMPLPFQTPARLADGLGLESTLSTLEFAPETGFPASVHLRTNLGYNNQLSQVIIPSQASKSRKICDCEEDWDVEWSARAYMRVIGSFLRVFWR